jgi:tetratricopeptide (TPR) repeat protein
MTRSTVALLACFALAVGSTATLILCRSGPQDPPAIVPLPTVAAAPSSDRRLASRIAALEDRVAHIEQLLAEGRGTTPSAVLDELRALKADLAALAASTATKPETKGKLPPDSRVNLERYAALGDDELRREAQFVVRSEPGCLKDFAASRDAWSTYLKRSLSPEQRVEGLAGLARAYFGLQEWERAAETYQDVMERSPTDSPKRLEAALQLSWSVSSLGDKKRALEIAQGVAEATGVDPRIAATGRWQLGKLAESMGAGERARREYEQYLVVTENMPELQSMRDIVRAQLARSR